MVIAVSKYTGDYSDLQGLLWDGQELMVAMTPALLAPWDLYVGTEDGVNKGYFLISPPSQSYLTLDPLRQLPYVAYLYNGGSADLLQALLSAIKATVKGYGVPQFMAMNQTSTSDAAWMQALATMGVGSKLASLCQFDVTA